MNALHTEKGTLSVFDGLSGSGKSTLISTLVSELERRDFVPMVFVEEKADERREEILAARAAGKAKGESGDKEMAQVLVEHRAYLYARHVVPEVLDKRMVLADRGEPATLAYQTQSGELSMEQVWNMHRRHHVPIPDYVVLTLCSAETSLEREEYDRRVGSRTEQETGKGLSGKISSATNASTEDKLAKRRSLLSQYCETEQFLKEKGVPVLILNTEQMTVSEEVTTVIGFLGLEE